MGVVSWDMTEDWNDCWQEKGTADCLKWCEPLIRKPVVDSSPLLEESIQPEDRLKTPDPENGSGQ